MNHLIFQLIAQADTGSANNQLTQAVGWTDALAVSIGVVVILAAFAFKRFGGRRNAVSAASSRIAKGEIDLSALRIEYDVENPAVVGWNQLITELKTFRDNEKLQEAAQADHATVDGVSEAASAASSLAMGIVVFDRQFIIQYTNGAAGRFLDVDQPTPKQDSVLPLLEPLALTHIAQQTVEGQRAAIIEEAQQDAEDARAGVMRVTCRRLPGTNSGLYMLLLEDITQQRVAEASRHAFIAEATHELRMPLQNMRLYVEQTLELGDTEEDAAERAEYMNIINSEVIRLGHMIEEVLSISAVESGALSVQHDDVRLDDMINKIAEEYRPQAETKSIALNLNLPAKLPVLQADREKLSLALHNIIGNAVKYTPDNGRVSISVSQSPQGTTIDVTDTGYGIEPGEHERVFERFYRASDRRVRAITGTGLGLAISRDIVRLHGGDIQIQSTPNEGSTFTIQLPPPAKDSSVNQAA